ncbi:MAG: serine/threonine-protein kinase [Parachlamydiaceae bacterium]
MSEKILLDVANDEIIANRNERFEAPVISQEATEDFVYYMNGEIRSIDFLRKEDHFRFSADPGLISIIWEKQRKVRRKSPELLSIFDNPKKFQCTNDPLNFKCALKATIIDLFNKTKYESKMEETAEEIATLVSAHFFSDELDRRLPFFQELPKNPFFDSVAFVNKTTCALQTKQLLGTGSYKEVYDGVEITFRRKLENSTVKLSAIAILRVMERMSANQSAVEQAQREDAILSEFSSSHVIRSSRYAFLDARKGIKEWVMFSDKYSFSLDAVCKGKIDKTFHEKIKLMKQASKGLNYLHLLNWLHRDIKPANIFVNENGKAVLGDFGFVKQLDDHTGKVLGSPIYTAPEVIKEGVRKPGAQTPASDLWAFGISLYQMCHPSNRRPPFVEKASKAPDTFKALEKIKKLSPTEFINSLFASWTAKNEEEVAIQQLITKLLSLDPAKRGTTEELHASLKKIDKLFV